MNSKHDLRWEDVVSPTMSPEDYLQEFENKIDYNYNTYEPKKEILKKMLDLMENKAERLKIVALGADWCPDCNRNVPYMIKIIKSMKSKSVEFRILYGIMKNALHKPGEIIWHKNRSPPEATNPKFNLKKIPTFYFFNKDHELIGMIQENPKKSIEEDLLEILQSNF